MPMVEDSFPFQTTAHWFTIRPVEMRISSSLGLIARASCLSRSARQEFFTILGFHLTGSGWRWCGKIRRPKLTTYM